METSTGQQRAQTQFLPGISILSIAWCISIAHKLLVARGLTGAELTDPHRLLLQIEWAIVFAVLVLGIVTRFERLPMASIGVRKVSARDIGWAVVFCFVTYVIDHLIEPTISASGLPVTHIRTLAATPLLDWTSIIAAAVSEELLYRGYFIERISALTGSVVTAAFFSWTLFSALHLPLWGEQGVVYAAIFGAVITYFYIWRRNLPACMLTHLLSDAIAGRDILFGFGSAPSQYLGFGIYLRVFR